MIQFNDSVFPGWNTAFDPEKIAQLLQNALSEVPGNLLVKEAKIIDVKYEPGKEGIILYRFKIKNSLTKVSHKQLFTASLLKEGEIPPLETVREDSNTFEQFPVRKPSFFFPGPKIVLRTFPNDPSIPWLGELLNEEHIKKTIESSLALAKFNRA